MKIRAAALAANPFGCVVTGGAWIVLLAVIGRDELRRAISDFSGQRKPTRAYTPPPPRRPELPRSVVTVGGPPHGDGIARTAEELERLANLPAAPDPRRLA